MKKQKPKAIKARDARIHAERRRVEMAEEIFGHIQKHILARAEAGHTHSNYDYSCTDWPDKSVENAVQALRCAGYRVIEPIGKKHMFIGWSEAR